MDQNPASCDGGQSLSMTDHEKKKMRNRLSQRAFRRRQAECIRELRSRVNADQRPSEERLAALQQENSQLRAQLVEVQAKLSRLVGSLQVLATDVTNTLDAATGDDDEEVVEIQREEQTGRIEKNTPNEARSNIIVPELASLDPMAPARMPDEASVSRNSISPLDDLFLSSERSVAMPNPIHQQIPHIWTFEYQMGLQPYMNAITATHESSIISGKEWIDTNSPFSDHIHILQCLLKEKFEMMGISSEHPDFSRSVYHPVSMVLSLFNSLTRPDVMAWYARTRFYHIIELTAWQLYPSIRTFGKLHERYRPTDIQLSNQHPRVIDWIPFPSIRDKLIQLHAANPHIDQIFCDAVTGYVVEALMSELILGAPPLKVYIRVTDLSTALAQLPRGASWERYSLPAPSASALFTVPEYAAAAFKYLNMDRGASFYKIDPAFFGKYPELYDASNRFTATGIPLKPDVQIVLTYPKPLDGSTVETYRSFIHFSLDAAHSISVIS